MRSLARLSALVVLVVQVVFASLTGVSTLHAQSAPVSSLPEGCSLGRAPSGSRVLVFSRTTGYRHASIPAAARELRSLGRELGFDVEHTEDQTKFTDANLKRFAEVVFLSNTQKVLDSAGRAAFQRFVRGGGGFVAIHSSSNAELDWPWFGDLLGARFNGHPKVQTGTVVVEDSTHLSTKCLPAKWIRPDEWYNFKSRPIEGAHVLLTVDEKSYEGGLMGEKHPVAWYHEFDGSRAWYTSLGHFDEHYTDPVFRSHIAGGMLWAMRK
jgi:type 1 glutamine amidotransferase